jgi:hypothetical protein
MKPRQKSRNPLGATRPREFLCMETKPISWLGQPCQFLLVIDAYSYAALGHLVAMEIDIMQYISTLKQVGEEHDLHDDVTIVWDLPDAECAAMRAAFPYLVDVRHDPASVAAITNEARTFLMAKVVEGERQAGGFS